jgi:hypothetical protein
MQSDRLSPSALLIAAASSAAAAVAVHALWAPGTVPSAALTPVLVAVFDELLRRPAEHLRAVARERARPDWWRAFATGAIAFAIGAATLTGTEMLLDRALGDASGRTTLLGPARVCPGGPGATTASPSYPSSAPSDRRSTRSHEGGARQERPAEHSSTTSRTDAGRRDGATTTMSPPTTTPTMPTTPTTPTTPTPGSPSPAPPSPAPPSSGAVDGPARTS